MFSLGQETEKPNNYYLICKLKANCSSEVKGFSHKQWNFVHATNLNQFTSSWNKCLHHTESVAFTMHVKKILTIVFCHRFGIWILIDFVFEEDPLDMFNPHPKPEKVTLSIKNLPRYL